MTGSHRLTVRIIVLAGVAACLLTGGLIALTRRNTSGSLPQLMVCVQEADVQQVRKMLARHPELATERNENNVSAVAVAVAKNDFRIVELLVDAGADVEQRNEEGRSLLHFAAVAEDSRIAEKLIECGANVTCIDDAGDSPLHFAAARGTRKVVRVLLSHHTSPKLLNHAGMSPLSFAAVAGNTKTLAVLLDACPRYWEEDVLPLHYAAGKGHAEAVELLLADGVDPDSATADGYTALHLAAEGGHAAVVEILIRHGADVRQKTPTGSTALTLAQKAGRQKIVDILRPAETE